MLDRPTDRRITILECLRDDPFLSSLQLSLMLGWNKRTVQWYLRQACGARHIRLIHHRQPGIAAIPVYALTYAGLETLATGKGMCVRDYMRVNEYHGARVDHLALVLERVYQLHSFLLHLQTADWNWAMEDWDVESALEFRAHDRTIQVPFHGIALLRNQSGNSLGLVIDYDTELTPVKSERLRFAHFCGGLNDARYSQGFHENKFPVLVVIAANQERLKEYRSLLKGLHMIAADLPATFLTARDKLSYFYQDMRAPIWETLSRGESVLPFCEGIVGTPDPLEDVFTWQRIPRPISFSEKRIELAPNAGELPERVSLHTLASLSLALHASDKQVLRLVGSHPLLRAAEIAQVMQTAARCVRKSLKRLDAWALVQRHSDMPGKVAHIAKSNPGRKRLHHARAYTLSELGVRLLAASAGYGGAVERFARVRGWKRRFDEMAQHRAHTEIENVVYLQFLQASRRFRHELVYWYSELESRLYIEEYEDEWVRHYVYWSSRPRSPSDPTYGVWGQELRASNRSEFASALAHRGHMLLSYLPDGRGLYRATSQSYAIQLEVDLSRASNAKLWKKLTYYYCAIGTAPKRDWRILIVTTSWHRGVHIAQLVIRYALHGFHSGRYQKLRGGKLLAELNQDGQLERFLDDALPVFITTTKELHRGGVAGPIWLDAWDLIAPRTREIPTTYCMGCFSSE